MQIIIKPRSIVERSSGWWIVDDYGVVEGPFDDKESAEAYIKIYGSDSVYSTKESVK
jgi:hypothetical protein